MKKIALIAALCLCLPSLPRAQDVEPIPADEVGTWAGRLAEMAAKLDNPQVKIDADTEKANGIHVPEELGLLVVPHKGFEESEELAVKFKEPAGTPMAYLFAYHVVPVIDGKRVEEDRLRKITVAGDDGGEGTIYVLLLAVRQVAEDDYRLYAYGSGEKPVVDAKFSEGSGPGAEPVAVELNNVDREAHQADAVITVFGKYQAKFRAGRVE